MTTLIIYPNSSGLIAIIFPTGSLPIMEVARKDVPKGMPFRFVDIDSFPLDGTLNEAGIPNIDKEFRGAWEVDWSTADGVGIGSAAWNAEQDLRNSAAVNNEGGTGE